MAGRGEVEAVVLLPGENRRGVQAADVGKSAHPRVAERVEMIATRGGSKAKETRRPINARVVRTEPRETEDHGESQGKKVKRETLRVCSHRHDQGHAHSRDRGLG